MKNLKGMLKMTGVCAITGAMSIIGAFIGLFAFAPECIHINKDNNTK